MNSNDSRTYNKCILSMIKNPLIYCVRLHEVDKSWSHAYVLHSLTCNFALHSSLITIITCIRLVEQNLSVHVDQIITELALLQDFRSTFDWLGDMPLLKNRSDFCIFVVVTFILYNIMLFQPHKCKITFTCTEPEGPRVVRVIDIALVGV